MSNYHNSVHDPDQNNWPLRKIIRIDEDLENTIDDDSEQMSKVVLECGHYCYATGIQMYSSDLKVGNNINCYGCRKVS